jgi:U3 small nucleolar RNA-associated protein 15
VGFNSLASVDDAIVTQSDDSTLACCTSDGSLSIRRRHLTAAQKTARKLQKHTSTSEAFIAGSSQAGIYTGKSLQEKIVRDSVGGDERRVKGKKRKALSEWDKCLKGFRYADALDAALETVKILFFPSRRTLF